ncbi:MAG: hypothetical protein Q9225_005518 [Loekoesia sp. 1 TL-2023]
MMQAPDPKYLRPAIHPLEHEKQRAFPESCASGDPDEVRSILQRTKVLPEYFDLGVGAAIRNERLDILAYLLSQVPTIDQGIVLSAALKRSIKIWEMLLDHGWDVNSPVIDGSTLLMVLDDESLVRWLFDHGALLSPPQLDVSKPAYANPFLTCLNAAACRSTIATFNMLLEHGASRTHSIPLHAAAGYNSDDSRIPMIAHLIELGFDVNATDEEAKGWQGIGTPLHHAKRAQSACKVKFLLENGADPHKMNKAKAEAGILRSALEMAEASGLHDIAAMMR